MEYDHYSNPSTGARSWRSHKQDTSLDYLSPLGVYLTIGEKEAIIVSISTGWGKYNGPAVSNKPEWMGRLGVQFIPGRLGRVK